MKRKPNKSRRRVKDLLKRYSHYSYNAQIAHCGRSKVTDQEVIEYGLEALHPILSRFIRFAGVKQETYAY